MGSVSVVVQEPRAAGRESSPEPATTAGNIEHLRSDQAALGPSGGASRRMRSLASGTGRPLGLAWRLELPAAAE